MLTAKAVQHVLAQLGETDLIVAQWLNNFAADTSPLLGDEFIMKLMKEVWFRCASPAPACISNLGYFATILHF